RVRLRLEAQDAELGLLERARHGRRPRLVESHGLRRRLDLPAVVEVTSRRDPATTELAQPRRERAPVLLDRRCGPFEDARDVPVLGRTERHPLTFTLDDE